MENARGAEAYALCYDGYVEVDDETKDALIAEGGIPGEDEGMAVGFLYTMSEDGEPTFEEEPAYIGEAPNFMSGLKEADQYDEDEIDEKYLDDEEDLEDEAE